MIRPALIAAAMTTLSACNMVEPVSNPAIGAPETAGSASPEPANLMDPGTISCTSIETAVDGRYIDPATIWAGGQMRAAVLSGAVPGPAPQEEYDEGIATFISNYCRTNTNATVRDAFNAMIAG